MDNFIDFVNSEIRKAVPPQWKFIASEKLLKKDGVKISTAFRSSGINGKSFLINVMVLPQSLAIDETKTQAMVALRDYILSKDCMLLVVVEQSDSRFQDDNGVFESEELTLLSPFYLCLTCYKNDNYQTTLNGEHAQQLHTLIKELWSGRLRYNGPAAGTQRVNLEIMADACWKCGRAMKTVTGIVFPDKQLTSWNNDQWRYYNSLVPLASMQSTDAESIQAFVEQMRQQDSSITPVSNRFSNTVKRKYWSASCPWCDALRGNFHVSDDRMQYLHDFESRLNGSLSYNSFEMNASPLFLRNLLSAWEGCAHACLIEWAKMD
jgi:hypothetical protein